MTAPISDQSVLQGGAALEVRSRRLADGASALASPVDTTELDRAERIRLTAAGTLMVLGVLVILLGWVGASRSIVVAEQLPYLISGGLLGLGLTVAGGFGYFAHWQRVARREAAHAEEESERRHGELLDALARALRTAGPPREEVGNGTAPSDGAQRPLRRSSSRQRR